MTTDTTNLHQNSLFLLYYKEVILVLWKEKDPLKPWQICLHFRVYFSLLKRQNQTGLAKWIKHTDFTWWCNSTLKQQRKTSKWVKFGKRNGRVTSCLAACPHFYLHFILHLYFRCSAGALIQWGLHVRAKKNLEIPHHWHFKLEN